MVPVFYIMYLLSGPDPLRGSKHCSIGENGNDGNSTTVIFNSNPQTPMTQMTQFQQYHEHDAGNGQYSNTGSVTSPGGRGACSVDGSLRRQHNGRMIVSPNNHPDLHSVGGSSTCVAGQQQPCSPMISFKPIMNGVHQHPPPTTSGILASPLPQPPNMFTKGSFR